MCLEGTYGWDLGGAHLKAAVVDGAGAVVAVSQLPCALWRGMERFHAAVGRVLDMAPRRTADVHAVTLTGELVDLFETRGDGVRQLLDGLGRHVPAGRIRVYAGDRSFLEPGAAVRNPMRVASANWEATAALLAQRLDEGLLVDVGSTTTDIIPFAGSRVRAAAHTDHDRLRCAELVYTGVVRTPVMALARAVPMDGARVPLMAEHFATAADVYRLLGRLPTHADKHPTADGGAKTPLASARRLARMVGCDLGADGGGPWRAMAAFLAERQLQDLQAACRQVLSRAALTGKAPLVGAGVGRFVVQALAARLQRPYLDFCRLLGAPAGVDDAGDCAPAVAVAYLAQQETT